MSPSKTYLSPKEVASNMGVHERTVRRWCQRGQVVALLTPSGANWRVCVDPETGFAVRR